MTGASTARDHNSLLEGEYRSVMSLVRVLQRGPETKATVDWAIDQCGPTVGNLRLDIFECRRLAVQQSARGSEDPLEEELSPQTIARGLGNHYLRRYFLLIAYGAYLLDTEGSSFVTWVHKRPEIKHLLGTLSIID